MNIDIINQIDLDRARFYIEHKNYVQAELFLRKILKKNSSDLEAIDLFKKIIIGYGLNINFYFSEEKIANHSEHPKYLLIKAWGYGFWSEAHHLVTQFLVAELLGRVPLVLWGKNCLYRNLNDKNCFNRFYKNINSIDLDRLSKNLSIYPKKWNWENMYEEDVNKWDGEDSRIATQQLFSREEDILVVDFYSTLNSIIPWIHPSSKYFGKTEDQIYNELFIKYLIPNNDIEKEANEFYLNNMSKDSWLAVHIRGSDKINESPNLDITNSYYLHNIAVILEKNPSLKIFLLTDSEPVVKRFEILYGNKLLTTKSTRTSTNIGVHTSGNDGLLMGKEVLIDALLAIKCDFFLGNTESNVSLAISSMKCWSPGFIFLSGQGNVRSENLTLHNVPEYRNKKTITELISKLQKKKRIIQVYKGPDQWINSPPGMGDFIRGSIHLHELVKDLPVEFKIDISQSDFANYINYDPILFQIGDRKSIQNAEEYFVDHNSLRERIVDFLKSNDEFDLYICTNYGSWNRLALPSQEKEFIIPLFNFFEDVISQINNEINIQEFEVLSIRCGDNFYSNQKKLLINNLDNLFKIIETEIIPNSERPKIITSDCYELKVMLAEKYKFKFLGHRSEHGAFGGANSVVKDLEILKRSKFNYHINNWATWWSGFSHYTSLIFDIPSMNFRTPLFEKEIINPLNTISTENIAQISNEIS